MPKLKLKNVKIVRNVRIPGQGKVENAPVKAEVNKEIELQEYLGELENRIMRLERAVHAKWYCRLWAFLNKPMRRKK